MRSRLSTRLTLLTLAVTAAVSGCYNPFAPSPKAAKNEEDLDPIQVVEISETATPVPGPMQLHGARNEWVDGYFKLPAASKGLTLKMSPFAHVSADGSIPFDRIRLYRVVSLPFDTRSVATVRSMGPGAPAAELPRVLIPLEGKDGRWELPEGTSLVYMELRAGLDAPAGNYQSSIEVTGAAEVHRLAVRMTVDDLALSDAPTFSFYGEVGWEDLVRLFPRNFKELDPKLLSRKDNRQVLAVERMDQIIRLARENRLDIGFTRLGPRIKETPRDGLRVDWEDYDSVVMPWLTGEVDPSGEGVSAFPLPLANLEEATPASRAEFVANVVGHFDQRRLLGRMLLPSSVPVDLVPAAAKTKVRTFGEGDGVRAVSLEALRQATWQAFAGGQGAARAGRVAPLEVGSGVAGDPERPAWFYPGEAFGVGGVVPTVGMKWARRAQQDYELLDLARRRGASTLALKIAQRATRYRLPTPREGGDLLTPLVSRRTWDQGLQIARKAAVERAPGAPLASNAVVEADEDAAFGQWVIGAEVPLLLPVELKYSIDSGTIRVNADLDLADPGAETSLARVPEYWSTPNLMRRDGGTTISGSVDSLAIRYPVTLATDARGTALPANGLVTIGAISGPNGLSSERAVISPVVWVLPSTRAPGLDAQLADWSEEELIHSGPLVRMLDRRSAQESLLARMTQRTDILARWDDGALYLAIRADDVPAPNGAMTNFVNEQDGRAVGEALCRLRLEPLAQGGKGLQLLLKPQGIAIEQASAAAETIRYASKVENGVWRAELRIPAAVLGVKPTANLPVAFNLVRYDPTTGESGSFAGPLDRDAGLIWGLLVLTEKVPRR